MYAALQFSKPAPTDSSERVFKQILKNFLKRPVIRYTPLLVTHPVPVHENSSVDEGAGVALTFVTLVAEA
jgi:hypothetical protein